MIKSIKRFKYENIFLIVCLIGLSVVQVLTSLIHTFAFDSLLGGGIRHFIYWYLFCLGLWVVLLLCNYLIRIYQTKLIQKMSTEIRKDMLQRVENLSFDEFHKSGTGDYTSRLSNDVTAIETSGFKSLYNLISTASITIFSLIALLQFSGYIMITTVVLTVMISLVPNLFSKKANKSMLQLSEANESFISKLQNILNGFSVLFFSNGTSKMKDFIGKYSEELGNEKVNYSRTTGAITFFISLISVISQLIIFVLTGYLASIGIVSFGTITSTGSIAGNVFSSLTQFNSNVVQIKSVYSIFKKFQFRSSEETNSPFKLESSFESIALDDVGYKYDENEVLTNINICFEKGKKYAITGVSGSGKSTLMNILLGTKKDYTGSAKLNGIEINTISDDCLHQYIGFIDHKNYIFNGTLSDNIALWRDYPDEEMMDAVRHANVAEIGCIDEEIGNGKRLLSEGQKQRIAIARALIQKKPILIIDEGTANLDQKNSEGIERELLLNPNLTMIMVTHHLNNNLRDLYDDIITLHS
ncbi:ABC transporter ATP-binding protein [Gorillibacterium timonense]|uniref:ABC transporter ATP-binding protein n=1 Tax=Gorillibacterium timonense TaxID=1689269 RepID=UPI00071C2E71|nr:ABC transporter ATP-binding protein [Gorillibacterium timonense]